MSEKCYIAWNDEIVPYNKHHASKRAQAIKKIIKTFVYRRENGRCFYCDEELTKREATLDHIIPYARGGVLCTDNVVLACEPCNNERGNMPAVDFLWMKISEIHSRQHV